MGTTPQRWLSIYIIDDLTWKVYIYQFWTNTRLQSFFLVREFELTASTWFLEWSMRGAVKRLIATADEFIQPHGHFSFGF